MSLPAVPAPRILALDPMWRGFGFAVLEGPTTLVDWGIRNAANGDLRALLRKVRDLVDLYRPDAIIVEDCRDRGSRRRDRVRKAIDNVGSLASAETEFCLISPSLVRAETKATYRFLDHPEIRMEKVLTPHYETTLGRVSREQVVLAVQIRPASTIRPTPGRRILGRLDIVWIEG